MTYIAIYLFIGVLMVTFRRIAAKSYIWTALAFENAVIALCPKKSRASLKKHQADREGRDMKITIRGDIISILFWGVAWMLLPMLIVFSWFEHLLRNEE